MERDLTLDAQSALPERHQAAQLRVLVFPEDELSAFNCALTLLLRHSLVDLYRPRGLRDFGACEAVAAVRLSV